MADYKFYPPAVERIDEIYDYTLDHWGQEQAEKYIRGMYLHFQKLADQQLSWRQLPEQPMDGMRVFVSRYEKHFVYFMERDFGIGILSVLHGAMDLSNRLSEDMLGIDFD